MNDAVATKLLILTASVSAAPVKVRGFFTACGAPGNITPPPRRLVSGQSTTLFTPAH